jgi:hypothetical protein
MQQQLDALEPAFWSAVAREMDGHPLPPDEFKLPLIECTPGSAASVKDSRR